MSHVWDFALLKDKRTNRQIDGQREPNYRTLLLAQRSKLFGRIQQIPFNCKTSTKKSLQQILSYEDENFFVKTINIIFILASFIIQNFKKNP